MPSSATPWLLPDDKLLADCRFEAYTASGPGGQKRNKSQSAVRITHTPTGISAVETGSRSQRENRIHALRNLRHRLAIALRRELGDLRDYQPPGWFGEYSNLRINEKNPLYPEAVADMLDLINAMHWDVSRTAAMLGVSTCALRRFLHDDQPVWRHVNDARTSLGMKPLRK